MTKITTNEQVIKQKLQMLNSDLGIAKYCNCKLADLDNIVACNEKNGRLQGIIEDMRKMLREEIDDMKDLLQHTK